MSYSLRYNFIKHTQEDTMPRPQNKTDLLKAAEENYAKMHEIIASMSDKAKSTPFDFSGEPSKKEAHWARDKNVRDILVHLYEWQQLMLKFVENNAKCTDKKTAITFLPLPYTFKTYGEMNMEIWKRHQTTSLEDATSLLAESHKKVLALISRFNDDELFAKQYFKWTGTSSLGSYFVSSTSSHYDWAIKKLKAHIKNCGE